MAVSVSNIVVGEAVVKTGASNTSMTNADFDSLTDVGATNGGVEISWEPDMVDIEIDQYGDAAKVIQSKVKVMVKTTLAEATLNNLATSPYLKKIKLSRLKSHRDEIRKLAKEVAIKNIGLGLQSQGFGSRGGRPTRASVDAPFRMPG